MTRILLFLAIFLGIAQAANAQTFNPGGPLGIPDPCTTGTKTFTPINFGSATTATIVPGVSNKKTYICALFLFAAAAENVGVVEGTGTNCSTVLAGVIGGTTAASGINFGAAQCVQAGDGHATIAATATQSANLCLITSGAVQLTGVIGTVQQ